MSVCRWFGFSNSGEKRQQSLLTASRPWCAMPGVPTKISLISEAVFPVAPGIYSFKVQSCEIISTWQNDTALSLPLLLRMHENAQVDWPAGVARCRWPASYRRGFISRRPCVTSRGMGLSRSCCHGQLLFEMSRNEAEQPFHDNIGSKI